MAGDALELICAPCDDHHASIWLVPPYSMTDRVNLIFNARSKRETKLRFVDQNFLLKPIFQTSSRSDEYLYTRIYTSVSCGSTEMSGARPPSHLRPKTRFLSIPSALATVFCICRIRQFMALFRRNIAFYDASQRFLRHLHFLTL